MAEGRTTPPLPLAAAASTAALIAQLAGGVAPVRRVWPPARRLALWLAIECGVVVAALVASGWRADLAARLTSPGFASEIVLLIAVGLGSAVLALLAAVPGREPARALALAACAGVVTGVGALYAGEPATAYGTGQLVATGWPCAAGIFAVAALPWLVLLLAVRRGATLVPGLAGLLSGSATFFIAAAAVRVACPSDERWHLLVFHLGSVVFGAAASVVLGLVWLSRWRRAA